MENQARDLAKEEFIEEFKRRTKQYVLRSIRVFQALPATEEARIIGKQFLRAASSTGANYRAACRARSKAEFFAKLSITIEEADESLFWMEVLTEANIMTQNKMASLMQEATEIVKILSKARKNT
jgi:four helix bundle protein